MAPDINIREPKYSDVPNTVKGKELLIRVGLHTKVLLVPMMVARVEVEV
jgi:hypothetical protein